MTQITLGAEKVRVSTSLRP